jgi:hypothetical protein
MAYAYAAVILETAGESVDGQVRPATDALIHACTRHIVDCPGKPKSPDIPHSSQKVLHAPWLRATASLIPEFAKLGAARSADGG